jgi:hypothetical protein
MEVADLLLLFHSMNNNLFVMLLVFFVVFLMLLVVDLLGFDGLVTLNYDQFFIAFNDIDVFLAEFTSFLNLSFESGGNLLWHVNLNFDGFSNISSNLSKDYQRMFD